MDLIGISVKGDEMQFEKEIHTYKAVKNLIACF